MERAQHAKQEGENAKKTDASDLKECVRQPTQVMILFPCPLCIACMLPVVRLQGYVTAQKKKPLKSHDTSNKQGRDGSSEG